MKRYTASVVGCGSGGGLSLSAYDMSEHFDLVAACDLRAEVRGQIREKYPGIQSFATHSEMFAKCPTEVISVSTFPPSHEEIAMAALRLPLAGIVVEKPLADTAAGGKRILDAVRRRGLPLVVPHSWFARDVAREIYTTIRAGAVGRLVLMDVQCRGWDIMSAGIHWVHFFLSVIDQEPVLSVLSAVDGTTRTYRDGMQVETSAVTSVEMASGIRLVMETGDATRLVRGHTVFRFFGECGTLEWFLGEESYRLVNKSNPEGTTITAAQTDDRGPHQQYIENLAHQMETRSADYGMPEMSLAALEVCEAAYLSGETGCRVRFPLEDFEPPGPTNWTPGRPYGGAGGGRNGRELPDQADGL